MTGRKMEIILSDEQQLFVEKALAGNNILVDACIGSGKTTAIQKLCDVLPKEKNILYLTYNRLLKLDARSKIKSSNVKVTNYHGFAWECLNRVGKQVGLTELVQTFNQIRPPMNHYDVLVLDEYQDIELELAQMLEIIKNAFPDIQIVAVGDMNQKIYDKTTLDVEDFIKHFIGEHLKLKFTKCFRLSEPFAEYLGQIWGKKILGVNQNCVVEEMNREEVVRFLSKQNSKDVLCLGSRTGVMTTVLNDLEEKYPEKYNKRTVYASIRNFDSGGATEPKKSSAIFTTYDSSKGMERPICVVFDYTEAYWNERISKPQQSYSILKNIFCVAASRGKNHIVFVNNGDEMLSKKTISTSVQPDVGFKTAVISELFDFKYIEDVEECYNTLAVVPVSLTGDSDEICVKSADELIDLSPCVGIYQEKVFFKNSDIEKDFQLLKMINKSLECNEQATLDEKILYLTALETRQNRYRTQVNIPFVTEGEKKAILDRLGSVFSKDEKVQVLGKIPFYAEDGKKVLFDAYGLADVVKDNTVYELKFVSELMHKHFLQCACYMIALQLEKGILWNVRNNQAYEIKIPNKKLFLDAVAKTATKGYMKEYYYPKPQKKIAVIDTETNFHDEVMSIGIVIADTETFQMIEKEYFILMPEICVGGMFSNTVNLNRIEKTRECTHDEAVDGLRKILSDNDVSGICAYNASFDLNHLPELGDYKWYDIIKIAAYRQYNSRISAMDDCTSTGRLKREYGAEQMMRRLLGNKEYSETHNALWDAVDELAIMRELGQPFTVYEQGAQVTLKNQTKIEDKLARSEKKIDKARMELIEDERIKVLQTKVSCVEDSYKDVAIEPMEEPKSFLQKLKVWIKKKR